jgi:hypothetical protein
MTSLLLRAAVAFALVAIAPCPTQAETAPLPQESTRELIEKIKDKKDGSPSSWFETLGERKDQAGLKALEQALGIVRSEAKLSEVARALRHFAGDPKLSTRALQVLRNLALERKPAEARAGVKGLTEFGADGVAWLRISLLDVEDGVARAQGLKPLVEGIVASPTEHGLALVLAAWRTPQSGSQGRMLEVLRGFRTTEHLEAMGKFVSDEDAYAPTREAVLTAVSGMVLEGDALAEADEVVDRGLAAKHSAVQFRALEAVVARGRALRSQPIEALARSQADELRRLAHVAMARLALAEGGGGAKEVMELGRSKDPAARQAAALELARLGTEEALQVLTGLLADPDLRVRSQAVKATAARRRPSSIVALIDRLDAESGKLRGEVRWALEMLTGKDFGLTSARWRTWWAAEGKTFEVPSLAEAAEARQARTTRAEAASTKASFYGLEVISNRLVFVIDISGSMNAKAYEGLTRIEIAKRELNRVVATLLVDDHFNIIAFSGGVRAWVDALTPGNEKNRTAAKDFVDRLQANGGTAIYDALAEAFEDQAIDTIYFLSDGDPSAGLVVDPATIRSEVARWNSARHIVIHCIAVGQDHSLLRGLAEDSGGSYRRVD